MCMAATSTGHRTPPRGLDSGSGGRDPSSGPRGEEERLATTKGLWEFLRSAVGEFKASRNRQTIGEYSGLVTATITMGVFKN